MKKGLSLLLAFLMVLSVFTPAISPFEIKAEAATSYPVELAFENIFVFEDWASNSLSSTVIADGVPNTGGTLTTDMANGSFRLTKTNMDAGEIYTAFSMGTGSASENANYYMMPVEPNTTYTFSYHVEGTIWEFTPFVFMFDNQGLFHGLDTMVSYATPGYGYNSFEFTTPADVTAIQIRFTIGDTRNDVSEVYANVNDIAIYKSELREAYNLFSIDDWASNPLSTQPGLGSGSIVPNVANGTITLTTDNVAGNTMLSGFGIDASASNDAYYTMDVQPNTSYTLCYSIGDNNLPGPVHSQPYIVEMDSAGKMITWYNYETPQLTSNKREFTTQANTARIQVVFSAINDGQAISRYCTLYNIGVYKTEVLNYSFSDITGHTHRKAYTYTTGSNNGTYGELPTPSNVPNGYVFAGWYTGENGTGTHISSDTEISYSSYTVYPKYEPAVDTLTVTTPPTKQTYTLGEKVNTTGLVLQATRTYTVDVTDANGNFAGTEQKTDTYNITSGYRYSPKYLTGTGTQTITVEYGGKAATFTVNVSASNPKTILANGAEFAVTVANNEYTLNFHPSSPFNRYEMTYYSDSYVKGEIVMDGVTEEFFLEPSDNGSFASYIDSFLRGVTHYNVDSIKFTCLDKEHGNFELTSVTTINAPVPGDSTQYYENGEYKVGISLDFGGVVSEIYDLKNMTSNDPVVVRVYNENGKDITRVDHRSILDRDFGTNYKAESTNVNIINTNDRGRYLQQSYYGTNQPPYEMGDYNGIPWSYNPVQGGNLQILDQETGKVLKGNESSKVVDYRITKDQIYVKTRPLDWGKNSVDYSDSYVTDSYMEAWYVFEDGMIKSYCRFVDFSGYPSNTTTQEYPALYTIEPLNNFVYNDVAAEQAWQSENLKDIEEPDFWGVLPEYNALLEANGMPEVDVDVECNENWAAFTASPDDNSFGIGVYSAGVTDFHYGVFPAIYNENDVKNGNLTPNYRHTASLDPAIESPTSYISPVGTMTFESYKPTTYSFYITTGTAAQIKNDFSKISSLESGEELAKTKVAVPETVYMTPASGASKVGQIYVNNILDKNDFYNVKTLAEREDDMYFGVHVADADYFTVDVSNATNPANDIFLCNMNGSEISGSIKCDEGGNYIADSQYGLRFSGAGLQPGEKATAKWEITVYLKDGSTKTHTAYTVMYAPGRTVGAVAEARQVDNSQNEISSWITGANGVDHSKNSPLGSFHGDKSASGYFNSDPLVNDNPPTGGSGETANDYIVVNNNEKYVLQTATNGHDGSRAQSYLGLLTVDKSRYTNTNQIPNLEIGFDALRTGDNYPKNSIQNYYTFYTLGTSDSFTGTNLEDRPSGWTQHSQYNQLVESHAVPYRETVIPSYSVSEIDGKYIHALNQAEAYQVLVARRYSTAATSLLCSVTDKGGLRDSVLTGYGITDTNPEFVEALKNAAAVLGDPSATQPEIDEARKELNDAMAEKVDVYYALKYDNLFSIYEFSQHPANMKVVSNRGTATYANGTLTVTNGTITGGEAYTEYESSDDYYKVGLKPNTEYVFEYDVTSDVKSQAFMFFYNSTGGAGDVPSNMSVKTNNGNWSTKTESNTWWGNYANAGTYHFAIKFTTGANTTQAGFRFGNTSNDPTTSTFSNVKLVESSKYYEDVEYSKTEELFKEYASYGALPTLTRPGYTHTGWQDADGNTVTGADIATEHKSIFSKWNENIYTVNYNKNGADAVGSADARIVSHFEQFPLPDNFSRKYYKFRGWAYTADATTPVFAPGQNISITDIPAGYINSNNQVTLYAVWERGYSLYFSPNNGTGEIPGSFMGYTEPHTIPENTTITREGYTFLGWSLDPNATTAGYVAGDTLTVSEISSSYIQTDVNDANEKFVVLHAVWRANARPSVTFDNLIDMPAWEKLTPSNATHSGFTGSGFTLTSNVGVGEGTFSSPYFDVTPGKQYKIDMDFEGDGWDVYIFFCDANGNWIDFTDGGNRYSSNGDGNQTRVFTAPDKQEVVKAQIRVDANNSANTVKFSNIRVYEVGTVEEGVSYETAKTVTNGTAYGELPVPTRYGYDFLGWVNAAGETVTAETIMNSEKVVNLFSKWEIKDPQLAADTVVIDFGLPVKIDVLVNDINMSGGTLTGIGTGVQGGTVLNTGAYGSSRLTGKADTLTLANGTATISEGKIVYRPNSTNYTNEIVFYYEYQRANGDFYYTTVTVIPAASIYFEETMFTFENSIVEKKGVTYNYNWVDVGTPVGERFQAEDRPGTFTFAVADADNVYGTDSAYANSTTYSMGSAKYVSVDINSVGKAPKAKFAFTGTGIDLFSVTDNTAGLLTISLYQGGTKVKGYMVSTYHGYAYDSSLNDGEGGYVTANSGAIFQVPAFRIRDLAYGTYDVVVEPMYSSAFDVTKAGKYGVYVDSVRIFEPMGSDNDVANDAYLADGEYGTEYLELRDTIIKKDANGDFIVNTHENSSLYFDGINPDATDKITDYVKNGPKNEVYLDKGQAIAFDISASSNLSLASLQIGMKLIGNNGNAKVTVMNATQQSKSSVITLTSATEQFYKLDSVVEWNQAKLGEGVYETVAPIVVMNNSDTEVVISLTSLKWGFKDNAAASFIIFANENTAPLAYAAMARAAEPQEPEFDPVAKENITVSAPAEFDIQDGKGEFTITTSTEVTRVTVDGVDLTDYETDEDGNKVWKHTFEPETEGDIYFDVKAYDEQDNESETIIVSATVTNSAPEIDDDNTDVEKPEDDEIEDDKQDFDSLINGSINNGSFGYRIVQLIFALLGKILSLFGGVTV